MLIQIETLLALHREGTMARAGASLRVSQSAVSKRISSLESYYGSRLVEKVGRNVVLTPQALELIERLGPVLGDIRHILSSRTQMRPLQVGVSESILSSWGPVALLPLFNERGAEFHAHRSPLVIEKVESGIYDLGICSGRVGTSHSFVSEPIGHEEVVLVSGDRGLLKGPLNELEFLAIESSSATWKSIKEDVAKVGLKPTRRMESFFSIGQMAKSAGYVGLVPLGVAQALGISEVRRIKPKLKRPVQVI